MGRSRTADSALRIEEWPEHDQAAWHLDCQPTDPFDDDGFHLGATLSPRSLDKISKGYGRWLRFLSSRNELNPDLSPLQRVTRVRLAAYFRELRKIGNSDFTVIGRFAELRSALQMLSPGQDVSWIVKPYGLSVYAALPKATRHLLVPDSGVLFRWGIEMMDDADLSLVRGLARYRDGLLIAMLAARGRRRRSMLAIRVGHELIRDGACYRAELQRTQVKTNVSDRFSFPGELTPYIDRYLNFVRPRLLGDGQWENLWINRYGVPISAGGMTIKLVRLTRKRFGIGFGPHRFRHAIATTVTLRNPENPGLPAAVLGISTSVASDHYIRAGQLEATRAYTKLVEKRRREATRVPSVR